MFDLYQPSLPAHLCDNCRYVTFNDPDEKGRILCRICRKKVDDECC